MHLKGLVFRCQLSFRAGVQVTHGLGSGLLLLEFDDALLQRGAFRDRAPTANHQQDHGDSTPQGGPKGQATGRPGADYLVICQQIL